MKGTGWFTTLLMYYTQYEKGYLPEPGGLNDQPGKYPELMTTLGYTLNAVDEVRRNKNKPTGHS